jgi:predicted MFS family arabinose efflux permease
MGLYSVFLGVGQFVGTAAGGKFADWGGIDGVLILSAILGLVTLYTLVNLRRQETPVAH